jgi:hypothetical protein
MKREIVASEWKMPPPAKIYEALGALADGRVRLQDDERATVLSSDGSKTYLVETWPGSREISSNDNASYWQGYLGYPAIAVLIARGLMRPRPEVIAALAGIPWKELNSRFRNDYERTILEAMARAERAGFDRKMIEAEAEAVLDALRRQAPRQGPRRRPARASRPE